MAFESPRTIRDLASRFGDDAACRTALADVRWRDGFTCPRCDGTAAWHEPTPDNLDAYLAEFCFRREYRDPGVAFEALLRGLVTPR
jgi:hypothetical protein